MIEILVTSLILGTILIATKKRPAPVRVKTNKKNR